MAMFASLSAVVAMLQEIISTQNTGACSDFLRTHVQLY